MEAEVEKGEDEEMEEKRLERRGRTKRISSGRRLVSAERAEAGGASLLALALLASRGLLLGRPPPNWCTRKPGPPLRLKTNWEPPPPPSNRPPPPPGECFVSQLVNYSFSLNEEHGE